MLRNTSLSDTLHITYPIIQAPMLGVTSPEMVAAVSNEGGLGSLPVGGLSPEVTCQLIQKTKSLTNKPFAVNLFAHSVPSYQDEDMMAMRQLLLQLAVKKGYQLDVADLTGFQFYTYHDQLNILIQEKISIVSFTFGCLDTPSIELLKGNGCTLIGTATCVDEALFLQQEGIDMIAVQGIEGGGHRGTFLDDLPLPQVGLFSLLPQIKAAVSLPIIAAGGIYSPQTIRAAFELGANAIQVGTPFIGTDESAAIPSYKNRLKEAKDTDTALTRSFSGRWARGIRNELMTEIELAGISIPPYPFQNSLTVKLRKLAQQADDSDYTNLWAGQSAGGNFTKTREVFRYLVEGYGTICK